MDGRLGILSVTKPLDRSVQADYNLIVHAADGGSPSLTATTDVLISVTVSDDAPPRWVLLCFMKMGHVISGLIP